MEPTSLAEIRSAEELIVHLDTQPRVYTVGELSDYICVPAGTILDSIVLEENHLFAVALYEERRLLWGEALQGENGSIELPHAYELLHESNEGVGYYDVGYYLSMGADFGNEDPFQWELPKLKLRISWGGFTGPQLHPIRTGYVGKRTRCEIEMDTPQVHDAIATLKRRVEALEAAILLARKRADDLRGHLGLTVNGRLVAELAMRARKADGASGDDLDARLRSLEVVAGGFDKLQVRLLRHLREDVDARDSAARVLELFYEHRPQGAEFVAAFRTVFDSPMPMPSRVRDDFLRWIERAFAALAVSPKADDFVELHLFDLLQAACETVPESYRDLWAELQDPALDELVREGWVEALEQIRKALLIKNQRPSVTTILVKGVSTVGKLNGIVAAGLSDQTVGVLLSAAYKATGSRIEAARTIGGVFLRYVAHHCVQHNSPAQRIFVAPGATKADIVRVAKGGTYRQVMNILSDKSLSARDRGERLKDFELARGFSANPRAIGLSVAINAIALFGAVSNDDSDPFATALAVMVGVGALGQAALKHDEYRYVKARVVVDKYDVEFERKVKFQRSAGAAVAGLALALSIWTYHKDKNKGPTPRSLAVAGVSSSSASFMSSALSFAKVATRLASILGIVGNVIGIAVIIASIVDAITSRSPKTLLESYLDHLEAPLESEDEDERSWVSWKTGDLLEELRNAIDDAGDALDSFKPIVGSRDSTPWSGVPTYWKAKKLGFGRNEICALFDVDPVAVAPLFVGADGQEDGA